MAKYKSLKMPPKRPEEADAELMDEFGSMDELPSEKRDADVEVPGEEGDSDLEGSPNTDMAEFTDDELMAEFKKRGLEAKLEEAPMEEELPEEEFPV